MTTDILILQEDREQFIDAVSELASDGVGIKKSIVESDWLCVTVEYNKPTHLYYLGLKFGRIVTTRQYKPFDI